MASGHWEKRSEKSYMIVIDKGKKADGTRDRIFQSVQLDSDKEADDYLADRLYEIRHKKYIKPDNITLGEYLDKWLAVKKTKLKPKTYHSYQSEIDRHIKPEIGNIKLQDLDPLNLQEYYSKMEIEGRIIHEYKKDSQRKKEIDEGKKKAPREAPRGLSQRTISYHHKILSSALKQAVKWKYIASNPALYVDVPTFEKKEMQFLYRREVEKFLTQIREHEYYWIIYTAIMTGMRQGEILGLHWHDIDIDKGLIHIRQQLQYVSGVGWSYPPPKSNKSKRTIPMQLPINKMFRDIKKDQETYRRTEEAKLREVTEYPSEDDMAKIYEDNGLIFCQRNGKRQSGNIVSNEFKELIIAFGRPDIRFHDLRHTFAALAIAAGITMEKLQVLLGHESISTTIDMYGHVPIEVLDEEMQKLSKYMGFETLEKTNAHF